MEQAELFEPDTSLSHYFTMAHLWYWSCSIPMYVARTWQILLNYHVDSFLEVTLSPIAKIPGPKIAGKTLQNL